MACNEEMYLRPAVKLEPLMCRWPAWPHLIAPACYAMNVAFRHLPHLRSFVATPSVHIAACADPALFGGPFVNLGVGDAQRVRALIDQTSERCAHLIAFAEAFRALDGKLQSGAKGYCMDEHYQALDRALAGLVELTYDLNNHPKVKIREEFLHESVLDNRACQEVCLHDVRDSSRPFFMSTPLLEGPCRVFLPLPFEHPLIDDLALMRIQPRAPAELQEQLVDTAAESQIPSDMFTSAAPVRNSPDYSGDGLRIRYFGHACVLLQTAAVSILIDPVTAWESDDELATLTFTDLPDCIDFVVLTHCHQDHVVPEMLLQLRRRVGQVIVPHNDWGNVADPSMKLILKSLGYSNIATLDPFDRIEIPDGEIIALPFSGEHAALDINSKQCVAVRLKGQTIVFLVDSDGVDPIAYRYLARRLGPVETLFIGMECRGAPLSWLYGSLLGRAMSRRDDESRRLSGSDCERAWRIIEELRCARAYVYAMGQEPWMRHLMGLEYKSDDVQIVESDKLVERCRNAGIPAERLKGCREFFMAAG